MFKELVIDFLATSIPRLAIVLSENLHREFDFDFIAIPGNKFTHLVNPFHKEDDPLRKSWFDRSHSKSILFIPPADERIGRWLAKAVYESRKGATVIGILPVRADKEWFHKYIQNVAAEVRFIDVLKSPIPGIPVSVDSIAVVIFKKFKGRTRFVSARYNGEIIEYLN